MIPQCVLVDATIMAQKINACSNIADRHIWNQLAKILLKLFNGKLSVNKVVVYLLYCKYLPQNIIPAITSGTKATNKRTASQQPCRNGSMQASQWNESTGLFRNICIQPSSRVGRKSTTALLASVMEKSDGAMSYFPQFISPDKYAGILNFVL